MKFCQVNGHDTNSAIHVCTFKECKSINRWVCLDCVLNGLHNHFGFDYNHIMSEEQFIKLPIKLLQSKIDYLTQKTLLIQQQISEIDKFIQSRNLIKSQLQQDLNKISKQYEKYDIEKLLDLAKNNFLQLENQQINQIITIIYDQKIYHFNLSYQKQLRQIIKQLQLLFQIKN
ncbi:hypothetical protein pb186bvf_018509 [Paramecium bursaria]